MEKSIPLIFIYLLLNFCHTYIQIHTYVTGIGLRLGLSLSSAVDITTLIAIIYKKEGVAVINFIKSGKT